jgi:outer membrane receptor for ferrienterochelin and colicin
LKAGIKLSGKYKNGDEMKNAGQYHNYIFAVADFSLNLIKEKLWIYANIDGGNKLNSYSSILEENKWISHNIELKSSSTPFIVNGGFKGKFINKLGYNAYVRYAVHKGMLQYAYLPWINNNAEHNTLSAVYGNSNEFTVGAAINWKSKEFEGGATAEFTNYTDCKKSTLPFGHKPLGYPPFKLDMYGTYNFMERFYAGFSIGYRSKCESYWGYDILATQDQPASYTTSYMKSYLNLSINLKYAINRNFSLFANGENLLNAQIQHLPNYLEKGINFTAGLLVKF